jgi:hypothetical protein
MGLTNFNRPSIDWISVASMDAWIFSDSLDFGFNRIGFFGFGFSEWMDVQLSKVWINVLDQSLFQRIGFGWFFRTSAFSQDLDLVFSGFRTFGFQ